MKRKILIAEDDVDIIELLRLYLENDGYEVVSAENGEEAFNIVRDNEISLAILDIMMPKVNGYELTKRIREITQIPILMLSAKNLDSEKILGLDLGADDYLTKPFNPLEVVSRVKALLRRTYEFKVKEENVNKKIMNVGDLVLNEEACTLTKKDKEVQLTPTEFKILAMLMDSPGRVFTKVQIYENINGEYFKNDDSALMVHIFRIREKIEDDPKNPRYLKTVRGLGYKIEKI